MIIAATRVDAEKRGDRSCSVNDTAVRSGGRSSVAETALPVGNLGKETIEELREDGNWPGVDLSLSLLS